MSIPPCCPRDKKASEFSKPGVTALRAAPNLLTARLGRSNRFSWLYFMVLSKDWSYPPMVAWWWYALFSSSTQAENICNKMCETLWLFVGNMKLIASSPVSEEGPSLYPPRVFWSYTDVKQGHKLINGRAHHSWHLGLHFSKTLLKFSH